MTITFPRDVPFEEFATLDVTPRNLSSVQVSEFTGQDRPQIFEGDWWELSMTYQNLPPDIGRQVDAFIKSLRGPLGTFVVRYPGYTNSSGAAATNPSSPTVDGDNQAGNRDILIKNAPLSQPDWLVAGDIIQVGPDTRPHWHSVLDDVDTAADGTATICVWPAIRNGTSNNDPVTTFQPKGLCRLVADPTTAVRRPVLRTVTLDVREVTGD